MQEFKTLNEEQLKKLLEGHVDVLTPLAQKEEAEFKKKPCPECKAAGAYSSVDPANPFVHGNPLPNKILTCLACGAVFSPYTGAVLRKRSTPSSG